MIPSGVGLDIVGIGINPLGLPSSSHGAAPGPARLPIATALPSAIDHRSRNDAEDHFWPLMRIDNLLQTNG
jgi:hypothetical protein